MIIELQFNSVTVQPADMLDNCPYIMSALRQYFPAENNPQRRQVRKKRETVASLIDPIISTIENCEPS